jgi:hypothetical protein
MTRNTPEFDQRIADWLEADPTAAPADVLSTVVAALPSIPQARRGLLAPWRFPRMNNFARAVAGVAIVAIAGVGVITFMPRLPGPGTNGTPTPTPTPAPTTNPTASPVARGIAAWTNYTSDIYGITFAHPVDWKVEAPATRTWRAGDTVLDAAQSQYADVFTAPEADTIGLFVWEMPAGDGADVESVAGLKAWAEAFCNEVGETSCPAFTQRAEAMCLNAGDDPCRSALLVPTDGAQYAFFVNWNTAILTSDPDRVRVVQVAREDGFPSAARYGGSVELLRSILTQMDVWTPGQGPAST